MNETEEKNLFRMDLKMLYSELVDDGKEYYTIKELQELNIILQCDSKSGVILVGPQGSGKTSLVRRFVQQNLNELFSVESIKVINIKPIWTLINIDIDKMLENISKIIVEYNSSALILYTKFENQEMMIKTLKFMDFYLEEIKKHYNIEFLKFIFEVSTESLNDVESIQKRIKNSCKIVDCLQKRDIDLLIDIMIQRVYELYKKYEVSYTRDILLFYIAIESGWNENDYNINNFIDVIEQAILLSKKSGRNKLEKDVAKILYSETFEYLTNAPDYSIRNTAIHEAGHTLLRIVNDKFSDVRYVSIIPGQYSNGVTSYEEQKKIASFYKDKEYFIKRIAGCLAGRIAESTLNNDIKPNAGASGDLKSSMQLINDIITKYGFSEILGKNYIVLDDEKYVSEQTKAKIEEEKRKILDKATAYARNQIFEHQEFVEQLSDRLFKQLVLSKHEIYEMWEKYLQSKNN